MKKIRKGWARTALVAGAVAGLLPLASTAGALNTEIALTHSPPTGAFAGDATSLTATLGFTCAATSTCSKPRVRLVYKVPSGEWRTRVFTGSGAATQNVPFTLEAWAVQYPRAEYYLVAEVDETYVVDPGASSGSEQSQSSAAIVNKRTLTARSPAAGTHTFDVTNQLRMSFLENSAPAVGADVLVSSADPAATWRGTTDSSGRVNIVIPRNDLNRPGIPGGSIPWK